MNSNIRLYTRKIGPQHCSANLKFATVFLAVIFRYVQRRRESPPFDGVENFRSTVHFRGVLIPHDRLRRAPRLSLRHTGFLGHTDQCRRSASASRALHPPNHHKTRHRQRSASRTGRITKTSLNCVPFFSCTGLFSIHKKVFNYFSTYKNEEDFSQSVVFFEIFFWNFFICLFFEIFWNFLKFFFWNFFKIFFPGFFCFVLCSSEELFSWSFFCSVLPLQVHLLSLDNLAVHGGAQDVAGQGDEARESALGVFVVERVELFRHWRLPRRHRHEDVHRFRLFDAHWNGHWMRLCGSRDDFLMVR